MSKYEEFLQSKEKLDSVYLRFMDQDIDDDQFTNLLNHQPVQDDQKSITSISITSNKLTRIPDSLGSFTSLLSLHLSDNFLQEINEKPFARLTRLYELDLSKNNLKKFPMCLKNLPSLKNLFLSYNLIESLPQFDDGDFPSLKWLNITFNQIKTIDPSISKIQTLDKLNLTGNQIIEIPEEMMSMKSLTALRINQNPNLSFIPKIKETKTNLRVYADLADVVIPGLLYIGDYETALNSVALKKQNVRKIVSVCDSIPKVDPHFEQLKLELDDHESVSIIEYFEMTNKFIKKAQEENHGVLVHCMMGISRSATICLAFLMAENKWTLDVALKHLKSARRMVNPNDGFIQQLKKWEAIALQ